MSAAAPRRVRRSRRAATTRGAWLRATRESLGLTQAEMGVLLGKHWNSIARLERGEQALDETTALLVGYVARDRDLVTPPAPASPRP